MASIAFIGLGNMGAAMARRLLDAGHRVSVYNRTSRKADVLVGLGARLASTPKEACERADAVISMVADDAASRGVWLGEDGILAANLAPASLAIECSTLSYDWVTELAAIVAARGLCYIDAPVTGLPADAVRGGLTLLVGAAAEDLERARPLLLAFCNRILRFGTVGTGTAYKLIINMIGAVQIASCAEGLAIAQRAGLNLALVAEAIATSQAASPQVVRNARLMVEGDHDRNVIFTAALRRKDTQYALRLARELGIGAPFGELAQSGLRELCERGRSQLNESSIFEVAVSRESPGKPGPG
jgi:3-hydroxyisobutyrate dehydrogenase